MKLKLDYYRILGLGPTASPSELKRAYRQLAVAWHPDRNPGSPLAEERFKAISEAYAVLSDPIKRRQYDSLGPDKFRSEFSSKDIFQGFEAADLFKEFGLPDPDEELKRILTQKPSLEPDPLLWQNFFAGFGQKPGPRIRSSPLNVDLAVSLKEAVFGAEKALALNTPGGPVKALVTVPSGSVNGQKLTLKGQGPPSGPGQKPGDLAVTLTVKPERDFRRRGDDILTDLTLTQKELQEGCQPIVKTLDGRGLKLNVKPLTRAGTSLKAPGYGVPGTNGSLLIRLILTK
ncbi:MAG: DnaJ domain-containing protein [Deltaproteobacteria bacterium]|nr:DnaJ domain-containing protein [Deltaproteobacteria bacterium]